MCVCVVCNRLCVYDSYAASVNVDHNGCGCGNHNNIDDENNDDNDDTTLVKQSESAAAAAAVVGAPSSIEQHLESQIADLQQ